MNTSKLPTLPINPEYPTMSEIKQAIYSVNGDYHNRLSICLSFTTLVTEIGNTWSLSWG
jgi:hypothetical protein